MSLIDGVSICKVAKLENPEKVFHQCMDLLERYAQNGLIHGDFNEFNLMVDESQKVFTIDFPQMVSTSHPDAEFYFERDQNCIHTLFLRKFAFVSPRRYKLKEIEISRHLDKEVRASGAGKMTADEASLAAYIKAADATPEASALRRERSANRGLPRVSLTLVGRWTQAA